MASAVPMGFLLVFSAIFVLGLKNLLFNNKKNDCEMTYMFQEPLYIVSFSGILYNSYLS